MQIGRRIKSSLNKQCERISIWASYKQKRQFQPEDVIIIKEKGIVEIHDHYSSRIESLCSSGIG